MNKNNKNFSLSFKKSFFMFENDETHDIKDDSNFPEEEPPKALTRKPLEKAAKEEITPEVSDEDILAAFSEDLSHYGEEDPFLKDEKSNEPG
jgi:hypothetical protein